MCELFRVHGLTNDSLTALISYTKCLHKHVSSVDFTLQLTVQPPSELRHYLAL